MRSYRKYVLLASLLLGFIIQISLARGNPVYIPLYYDIFYMTFILILIFVLTTIIEYGVLHLYFKKFSFNNRDLYYSVIKVNLVTFPLTQVFAYFISIYFFLLFYFYIIIIEFLVVIVEWLLLKVELLRVEQKNNLTELIRTRKILKGAFFCNLTSYLFGLIIFLPNYFL